MPYRTLPSTPNNPNFSLDDVIKFILKEPESEFKEIIACIEVNGNLLTSGGRVLITNINGINVGIYEDIQNNTHLVYQKEATESYIDVPRISWWKRLRLSFKYSGICGYMNDVKRQLKLLELDKGKNEFLKKINNK